MGNQVGQVPQIQPEVNNANNRLFGEFVLPQLEYFNLNIIRPQILANNLEQKPVMVTICFLVQ